MSSINNSCVMRRCDNKQDSSGEIELLGKQECAKNVAELNYQTARYSYITMGLGTTQDSVTLRDELRRIRTKICELAKKNGLSLTSLLKNNAYNSQELPELERLYRLFSSCLEVTEAVFSRSLSLQTAFPLHTACSVLIHTGLTEAVFPHKFCVSLEHVESAKVDQEKLEKEDVKGLRRDVEDIHQILYDLNQKVDVKPWAMDPELSQDKINHIVRSEEPSETSTTSENLQTQETRVGRRRRCVCLVTIMVIIVVVVGATAGICIPLFLGET